MAKRKIFSPMISEFLFYEENSEKKEKINYIDLKIQIRELIKNRFERDVLTTVLLDLRKDVSGNTRLELLRIYQDLELHKDAYKKMNSWRWEQVSKGIYELTQMDVKDSYMTITRFINDKRPTIRKQAEIATVSLKEEGINYFLDHTRFKISEWQQLKLLDVIRNKSDFIPPPFRLWLTSKNSHVVLFALRLIKYYNQNDASASLIELLRHRDNQIKKEAIFCIRDFNVTDAVPELKKIFWKCTTNVKMYILEALSQLGTDEDIGFIETIVQNEMAFTVKGKAISALNTIRPEGVLPTRDLVPKEDFNNSVPQPESDVLARENPLELEEDEEQNEIKNILVNYEVVSVKVEGDKKTTLEITSDEISFLPVVTDAIKETPKTPSQVVIKEEATFSSLSDIIVNFEEVFPLKEEDELNFEFLPIVIPPTIDKDTENSHHDLLVIFEEITGIQKNKEEPTEDENLLQELPVTFEVLEIMKEVTDIIGQQEKTLEKTKPATNSANQQPEILFTDAIATNDLINFPVIYEELKTKTVPQVEETNLEIEWSTAFESRDEISVITERIAQTKKMVQENYTIPKPLFYTDSILSAIVLVEDIAELGDYREIPYLKKLLNKKENVLISNRISEIIKSFSITDTALNGSKDIEPELRQSVFQTLFEISDNEAQIILLNEISEVGDEQEIAMLHTLTLSKDPQVKHAVLLALEKLTARALINTETKVLADFVSMDEIVRQENLDEEDKLMINFELESPSNKEAWTKKDQNMDEFYGNTIFDHLCAMSTKLYDKK